MKIRLFCILIASLYFTNGYSQYVGIGVANPTLGRLQINGGVGKTTAIFGGDGRGVSLQRNFPGIGYNQYDTSSPRVLGSGINLLQYLNTSTGSMIFNFYNTSAGPNTPPQVNLGNMTIRQNGNVTLNGLEENASLFVKNISTSSTATCYLKGTKYKSTFISPIDQATAINGGIDLADVLINDQSSLGNVYMGNGTSRVGINRTNPQAFLEIGQSSNNRGFILVNPVSFSNWEFSVTKNLTEPGSDLYLYYNEMYRGNFFHLNGDWYQLSDKRFKTDITPLPSLLDKVMLLRPVEYNMRAESSDNEKSIGFIAQEVNALFPELITIIQDTTLGYQDIPDLHMMKYDAVGPIAIKAIQEQQEKVKKLQDQNAALRLRIEAFKKKLATLSTTN
jgi:Chaperone of endosialidase